MLKMKLLGNLFVFVALLKVAYCCTGYALTVNNIRTCTQNSVMEVRNLTATLNNNCILNVKECLTTKGFASAKATFTFTKAPLPPQKMQIDLCNISEANARIKRIVNLFSIPTTCPKKAGNICRNNNVNITNLKSQLPLLIGTTNFKIDVDHGNSKSCVTLDLIITKK